MLSRLQAVLIVVALVAGAINTLCFTLQNKQTIVEYGVTKRFFHPYMQAAMRYVSNSLIIFVAIATKRKFRDDTKKKPHFTVYILVGLLDVIFSISYYTALNFIPNSVYQILRGGGTLASTYLFNILILKMGLVKQKIIGCVIIIAGISTAGLTNYLLSQKQSEGQLVSVGYALIVLGIIINGLHYVCEQYLLRTYGLDPLWMLSIESLSALSICALFIPFLSYIPCPFKQTACVYASDGELVVQSIKAYFSDVFSNDMVLLGVLLLLVSMATYIGTGIVIVKKMSSIVRAVVDVSRTVLIWMIGIIITVTAGSDDKTYQWESLEWKRVLGQCCGFTILIFGNFIYYQIVTLQCFKRSPGALVQTQERLVENQQQTVSNMKIK